MNIRFNAGVLEHNGEWIMAAVLNVCNNRALRKIQVKITDVELFTQGQVKEQANTEYFLYITSELPQLSIKLMTRENYNNDTCTYENLELSPEDRDSLLCELVKGLAR